MVGPGEANQACSKGLSESLKEDKISQLPDHLIRDILYHLSLKEAVSTSVLSPRWRSLWLLLPRLDLDLDSRDFPNSNALMSFGDSFFNYSRVSCIHNLKLILKYGNVMTHVTSWIDAAVKRDVKHLHVHFAYEMPLSLYTCMTLMSLKLYGVPLPSAEFVSLPCLKILHLDYINYPNETTLERIVSSCPVLEELEMGLTKSDVKVFRVLSRSLKRFTISIRSFVCVYATGFLIDAPRLRFLGIKDNLSERFTITNIDSYVNLEFDLSPGLFSGADILSWRNSLHNFLPQVSNIRDMSIRLGTFQLLYQYSKLEPLPQFVQMSRLHVIVSYSHSKWLPTFLESFPNLKSLILECYNVKRGEMPFEEMNQVGFSSVPQCLLSSLEFVDFKVQVSGLAAASELVRYFLENSAILKKFNLPLDRGARNSLYLQDDYITKFLKIKRRSTDCEVFFF